MESQSIDRNSYRNKNVFSLGREDYQIHTKYEKTNPLLVTWTNIMLTSIRSQSKNDNVENDQEKLRCVLFSYR